MKGWFYMSIRSNYEFSHDIYLEINGEEQVVTVGGSIETWNDVYGEDADGNRGIHIIDSETVDFDIVDSNGKEVTDKELIKKIEVIYEENYAKKNNRLATENHNE